MAKISDGRSVTVTAPAGGVVKDNFYYINGFFGAALDTVAEGEQVALDLDFAEHRVATETNFAVGEKVYFSSETQEFTNVDTDIEVGVCTEATENGYFAFIKTKNA